MTEMPVMDSKEKYGVRVNLHDFGQATFEDYQIATLKASRHAFFQFGADGSGVTANAHVRGETVRVAIRLKIVTGVTVDEVKDMKPYVVEWLAGEISQHVKQVVTAPADPY